MPSELIFTSVPKGVKPGSTGYCTVAKHKGIDRLLDQAVEKLCFYELMKLSIKPVVHNYSILSLNTGTFHVLTRTCYSGSDHTGRTNYISHNLIFDQRETLSQLVSPAEIFLAGTGWLSTWPEGQSPMFFQEGICNIVIPKPSGNSSYLPTWEQLTGKSNLAHELKGYGNWKFITEGGEHNKTLSLLSEFSWLDPSYLEISWNQLTFTTYLQPSEKASNFRIVAGDPSVPAFNAISCATLNISSSGGANACFSSTGTGHFGPLPEIHQPIVEEHQNSLETVPIEPVYDEKPFQTKHPPNIPVQPESPTVSPTPRIPRRKSNLNLGKPGDSKNLYDSAYIPKGKGADARSKLLILLISFFGFLVLGAAIFAGVYFWPEKAKRGNTHSPEIAKAKNLDEPDVNESKTSTEEKERSFDDNEKSKVPEEGLANTNKEETFKSENSLDSLKDSNATDEDLKSKFTQKKTSPNPLPNEIPLEIKESRIVSKFSFVDSGRPDDPETKTFYWDHKNKTCTEEGQSSMHIAYWTTVERINDENASGTKIQTFHLLKDQKYKVDKKSFPKLKIDKDKFEVKSSSEIPDLKFPLNDGRGAKDSRITRNNPELLNLIFALEKLKAEEFWADNNLTYRLIHENGNRATNVNGALLTKDGKSLAALGEHFVISKEPTFIKNKIQETLVPHIDGLIVENKDQKKYDNSEKNLKNLLGSEFDFSKKTEELVIEITDKAISKIIKFKSLSDIKSDIKSVIKNALKNKELLKWINSSKTYEFDDWHKLREFCVEYKKETHAKKISDAEKKLDGDIDKLKNKKKEIGYYPNKKEKLELEKLDDNKKESDKKLKELKFEKNKDIKELNVILSQPPREFKDFKENLKNYFSTAIRRQESLSQDVLEKLEEYQKNLQNFLNGPQYPWHVLNKTSKKKVLIIE